MSSERSGALSLAGAGVCVLVGAAALWTAYHGAAFLGYELEVSPLQRAAATVPPSIDPATVDERLSDIAAWTDISGLGDRARLDERAVARLLLPPGTPAGLPQITALLDIDPSNGGNWLDLARTAHQDGQPPQLAEAAFTLSVLTAPWEGPLMRQRIRLIVDNWDHASDEERRRGVQDMVNLLREQPQRFRTELGSLLTTVPAERRAAITAAIRERYPAFAS